VEGPSIRAVPILKGGDPIMTTGIGKSLTLKWMVFSVLLATIPLAIAGFSIIQIYQDNLKKSVITIEKEKANIVVGRTRSFFEKITSNVRSLSIDEHLRQGGSVGRIKSLLEDFLNQNDCLSELTLLNEKGQETIKVSKYRTFKSSDLKDQSKTEIFRVASNLRTYYGGFKLTKDIVPTIVIGVPIGQRKRPTDVLSAEIHLTQLWNLIPQIQIGEKGATYVVNGEGDLIAHLDTTRVTSRMNVKHLPMVNRALAGEEGNLEFKDSTGEKYLVVYKPIKELGWAVIVQVPVGEAYEPIRQVARTALYWILVGLTVAVIFSLFLTRKLTLSIKNLSKEMREVAKGNLDTYIQPTTKDELGLLTESFNHMAQALKQSKRTSREAEEKYRTILENIEDGYYEVDVAGNFTFLNDSMCRIFGYSKEELKGMNDRQYTDQENAKRLFQAFNKVYRTGEPRKGFDYEIIRKDGTKRNVEVSVSLQKDSSGEPIGFRGILRDITDKKKMEEQLLQAEKLRALGEMASGVAHDFNNALTAILGNTQLLLHTAKDEDLKGNLKVIEKVARESAQTVRRLQEFTSRRVRQELFKINVNDVIKDATEITKPRWKDEAQAKGIYIDMVSNFDQISTVIGEASELREVITNMIFNAIEAMPKGGRIEIRTFQRKEKVYIQISDTGMGMIEEVKKKIFEPFFTTKPFSNAGLGLSMSYGIVKRFGGEIEVESIMGHGTTFTIILPVGLEGKGEVATSSIIQKGREARILVIDDEETVRSVLFRILSQVKHRVTVAENGEEGIRLFKEEGFDIVLTDLGMPGISGWEVGKTIKKMSPRTPVGMITGWGMEVNQATIKENGIDFVISKPFQFNQILKVIDETIASKAKLFMT
jgi:PAS domain S-box-containing protein